VIIIVWIWALLGLLGLAWVLGVSHDGARQEAAMRAARKEER
jgi:hypothetical protein